MFVYTYVDTVTKCGVMTDVMVTAMKKTIFHIKHIKYIRNYILQQEGNLYSSNN